MSTLSQTYYSSSDELLNLTKETPLTYVDWLQRENSFDRAVAFEQYTIYLNQWYTSKGIDSTAIQSNYIRGIYIDLLKQIALEYSTSDEKRFLENIDYNNNNDLDVALPFFTKKIKQIAIYYAEQRDEIKYSPIKANLKGSEYGIHQILYKKLAEIMKYDPDVKAQLRDLQLTLLDVLSNLSVDVVELYDTEQNYYNIPKNSKPEDYTSVESNRFNYFSMSTVPDGTGLFLAETYTQAMIELVKEIPVVLETTIQTEDYELTNVNNMPYAITDIVTGTELDRLDSSYFTTYTETGELNIDYEKLAFQKYSGTDYYYLSTGDTLANTVSGKLFDATSPHKELLNRFYPTVLNIPGENLYKKEFVGGFFTTTGVGLLSYTALDFEYRYTPEIDTIKYFPDPKVGSTGYYGSYTPFTSPVKYYENVNWHKLNITSHFSTGVQRQLENIPRFSGYQASKTDNDMSSQGVSRSTDRLDFWSYTGDQTWSQQDIFPYLDNYVQPIDDRQEQLLVGNKVNYRWRSDIYGNEYVLSKAGIDPEYKTVNTNESKLSDTVFVDTLKTSMSTHRNLITNNAHSTKNLQEQSQVIGTVYIRNNSASGVQTLESSMASDIFKKYTSPGTIQYREQTVTLIDIYSEIITKCIDMDVIYDVIIIETQNYIVVEKIEYDYQTGNISSGQPNFCFIMKNYTGSDFEKTSNWWLDEKTNRIIISKTSLHPELSGSNSKMIYPEMYVYKTNTGTMSRSYPDPDYTDSQLIYETSQYSLSSQPDTPYNIINTQKPVLTYNKDSERFSVVYTGKDNIDNIYMFKTDFRMYDETIELITNSFYKNNYNIYTANFTDTTYKKYLTQLNPTLSSTETWYHDSTSGVMYMNVTGSDTSNIVPLENSSTVWSYGTDSQNFVANRDIVVGFEYAMTGTLENKLGKPNGLSVIFFQARRVNDPKKYKSGLPPDNFLRADTGGLGSAFGYLPDETTGTDTQQSVLTGLSHGHACVILDAKGNCGNSVGNQPNSIVTFGPYDSTATFNDVYNIQPDYYFPIYQSTPDMYEDLVYTKCKIVLTDLGRKIKIYIQNEQSVKYNKITEVDISQSFPEGYVIPERLKMAFVSNNSDTPGMVLIKNITTTGLSVSDSD